MLAFLVRRTENASRFGPPGPKCTRTDFTVTPTIYIVSVSSQPEAINFSMGIGASKRWNRIGFYSSVSPIEKLMASGCDETETT